MCNAPKFGEIEERTGYGGGYNERGVVEYIKRDESDDEYDEVSSIPRLLLILRWMCQNLWLLSILRISLEDARRRKLAMVD